MLRTIGFDRHWARGEGAYLYDADGNRFLDMLGGFGMYNVGRYNPRVRAALHEALDLELPGRVALGITQPAGAARGGAARARAGESRPRAVHELGRRVGGGGDQDRPRGDGALARRLASSTASTG